MSKKGINAPRKAYAKPCIAIEDFTLNQFIAACVVNVREDNWRTQLYEKDPFTYAAIVRTNQFGGILVCEISADVVTDDMDTLCYHTATSPLFTS